MADTIKVMNPDAASGVASFLELYVKEYIDANFGGIEHAATVAALPGTGNKETLYVVDATNDIYIWNGLGYSLADKGITDEIAADLAAHEADAVKHITSTERNNWNTVITNLATEIINRKTDVDNEEAARIAADNLKVAKAGDTMTGILHLTEVNPTDATDRAVTKEYTDSGDALNVKKAGDVMTGYLTLNGDPTNAKHAATKQYVDDIDAATDTALAAEVTRATTAETLLTSNLTTEVARATAAETLLTTNLTQEITDRKVDVNTEEARAKGVEDDLQTEIDTEEARSIAVDTSLRNDLNSEIALARAKEGALGTRIDTEHTAWTQADADEAAARIAGDATLNTALLQEAADRTSADATEKGARQTADATLQTNIDTETSTRAAADLSLQSNIDTETAARIAGDTLVNGNVTQEVADRTAADTALGIRIDGANADIAQEVLDRTSADTTESTARIAADAQEVIDRNAAVASEAGVRAQADSDEQNARLAEDTAINTRIDDEVDAREAADTALDTRVDALEALQPTKADKHDRTVYTQSILQQVNMPEMLVSLDNANPVNGDERLIVANIANDGILSFTNKNLDDLVDVNNGATMVGDLRVPSPPATTASATSRQWVEQQISAAVGSALDFIGFIGTTEPANNLVEGMKWIKTDLAPQVPPDEDYLSGGSIVVATYTSGAWVDGGEFIPQMNQQVRDTTNDETWFWAGNIWERLDFGGSVFNTDHFSVDTLNNVDIKDGAITDTLIAPNANITRTKIAPVTPAVENNVAVFNAAGDVKDSTLAVNDILRDRAELIQPGQYTTIEALVADKKQGYYQVTDISAYTDKPTDSELVLTHNTFFRLMADSSGAGILVEMQQSQGILWTGAYDNLQPAWYRPLTLVENGKVDTVDNLQPDANKNIALTQYITQADYDVLVNDPTQAQAGVRYIITDDDGSPVNTIYDTYGPPDITKLRTLISTFTTITPAGMSATVPEDGYIQAYVYTTAQMQDDIGIKANGVFVWSYYLIQGLVGIETSSYIFVKKGTVINYCAIGTTTVTVATTNVIFCPCLKATAVVPTVNSLLRMGPPDYTNIETVNRIATNNGTWTVDRDGYAQCTVSLQPGSTVNGTFYVYIIINGTNVESDWQGGPYEYSLGRQAVVQVKKGDVIKLTGYANVGPSTTNVSCYFIPPVLYPPLYLRSKPLLNYSSVEQETGRQWIDGRMIYTKTITCPIPAMAAEQWVNTFNTASDIDLTNMDLIIDAKAIERRVVTNYLSFNHDKAAKQIQVMSSIVLSTGITSAIITLDYTRSDK